jgi:septum formation protein
MRNFVLASASPARLELLRGAGIEPIVVVSNADESGIQNSDLPISEKVAQLAKLKATSIGLTENNTLGKTSGNTLVLGCDSLFEIDGEVYGKPEDEVDCRNKLRKMSGNFGYLYTGHYLVDQESGQSRQSVSKSKVVFDNFTDEEIEKYIATGEPIGVAGNFKIDGRGAAFIKEIEGDYYGIVGLSLNCLYNMLKQLDISITDLWKSN